jgi:hypothetical protein
MQNQLVLTVVLTCLLFDRTQSFGSECKQIINEHFFDLSPIESLDDYYFPYKDSEDKATQIYFNFCQSVRHSCPGTEADYHMMSVSEDKCIYYKPISDNEKYGKENEGNLIYLINESGGRVSDKDPADGISSLFQGKAYKIFRDPDSIFD